MDSVDPGSPAGGRQVEISVDAYSTILSQLAGLHKDVKHLLESFEKHEHEKSKLGERVGAIEEAIPEKLDERLRTLELKQGQAAILGCVALFVVVPIFSIIAPIIYSEIKRPVDSQPIHPTIQRNP